VPDCGGGLGRVTVRSRYNHVDLWPPLIPSRFLRSEPEEDRRDWFAKRSSGVCELYSYLLRKATAVPAHTGWIRIGAYDPADPPAVRMPGDDVHGYFMEEPPPREGGDGFAKPLDPKILTLRPEQRPEAYLRWLQPGLVRLAQMRGVSPAGFEETFTACLAEGSLLRWEGPGRSSRDRRLRATPLFWFDAEGDAWVRVVVRDRTGAVVAEGGPWDATPTLREWRFAAKTLRWEDDSTVTIEAFFSLFAESWGMKGERRLRV